MPAFAVAEDVTVDLGELDDFSGTTLKRAMPTSPRRPDAWLLSKSKTRTSAAMTGGIQLIGGGANITDEQGRNAHTFPAQSIRRIFRSGVGRNFITEGSFVNQGLITVLASEPGFVSGDIETTLTINGSYAGIGHPFIRTWTGGRAGCSWTRWRREDDHQWRATNYNAARKKLNKTWYQWEAANGRSATTQVLGGSRPLDIVTSNASLSLFGPNTGLRDKFGNDALRNLAVSARFSTGPSPFHNDRFLHQHQSAEHLRQLTF